MNGMDKEELKQIYASIHTLRMEGDAQQTRQVADQRISIHTLRVEGDGSSQRLPGLPGYFNPHPPHGG